VRPKMLAQDAYTRMQHARKHFGLVHRAAYTAALGLGYAVRALAAERDDSRAGRRAASRAALRVLVGLDSPPFGEPPRQAVPSRGVAPMSALSDAAPSIGEPGASSDTPIESASGSVV
jgi:hypothetical protein